MSDRKVLQEKFYRKSFTRKVLSKKLERGQGVRHEMFVKNFSKVQKVFGTVTR